MGNVNDGAVAKALEVLRAGGVILYPTDTIWGIGCDATNPKPVARVSEINTRAATKAIDLLTTN